MSGIEPALKTGEHVGPKTQDFADFVFADSQQETTLVPQTLDSIQEMMLEQIRESKLQLPSELLQDLLHLHEMNIFFVDLPNEKFLPLVFIAAPGQIARPYIEQASGLILFDRRKHGRNNTAFVGDIKVSGIASDSNNTKRILGVTYDPNNLAANQLGVSTPVKDREKIGIYVTDYDHGGMITRAMLAQVHKRGNFEVRRWYSTYHTDNLDGGPSWEGYYCKGGIAFHEVGNDGSAEPKWHLRVPSHLTSPQKGFRIHLPF